MLKNSLFSALLCLLMSQQLTAGLSEKQASIIKTVQRFQEISEELKNLSSVNQSLRDSAWVKFRNTFLVLANASILFSVTKLFNNERYLTVRNIPAALVALIAAILSGHEGFNALSDYRELRKYSARYKGLSIELEDIEMRLNLATKQNPRLFEELAAAVEKDAEMRKEEQAVPEAPVKDMGNNPQPQA